MDLRENPPRINVVREMANLLHAGSIIIEVTGQAVAGRECTERRLYGRAVCEKRVRPLTMWPVLLPLKVAIVTHLVKRQIQNGIDYINKLNFVNPTANQY